MEDLLKQLIGYLENVSPQLWSILMKQAYSSAIADSYVGILLLVCNISAIIWVVKLFNRSHDIESDFYNDDYTTAYILLFFVIGICSVLGLAFTIMGAREF